MALTCPHCGHANFDDAKVCRRCRKDISNRCPECGTHHPPSATFCTKCGAIYRVKINTDAYRQRPTDDDPTETKAEAAARGVVPVHQTKRELKKCPECFHKVDAQAPFCIYCGFMFGVPEATPAPEEPHPALEPAPPPRPAAPNPAAPKQPTPGAPAATPPRPGAPIAPKAAAKPAPKAEAESASAKEPGPALPPPRPRPAPAAEADAPKAPPRPVRATHPEAPVPEAAPPIPPRPRKPKTSAAAEAERAEPTPAPAEAQPTAAEPEPKPVEEKAKPAAAEDAKAAKPESDQEPVFHEKINPYLDVDIGEADLSEVPGIVPLPQPKTHTAPGDVPEGAGRDAVGDEMVRVNGEDGETKLAPYFIDRYPVTNEDYRKFVEATGVEAPPDWKEGRCIHGMDRYPVTSITFAQARAFARWAGKRIPTAREWERAAGGDRGLRYPWGEDVEPRRAHFDVARNCLEPVDAHPDGVSPVGCFDMMGNAAEWTLDFKLSEPILKGGSYVDDPKIFTTKTRCRTAPDRLSPLVGFRCARDAE